MKNIIKVLALAIAMVTISTSTYAQKNERQRMTREQLAETQARFIAKFLTPSQIERVYELERGMMNRLFNRSQNKGNHK